jgi:hypothetical protein
LHFYLAKALFGCVALNDKKVEAKENIFSRKTNRQQQHEMNKGACVRLLKRRFCLP